ncbi:triose-phosphate isomerase [Aliidiomarina minuta]|uniref:Triosephosphate isomerase n=1 Tax=Aliidiomarina minuta TaxID=880057 RepID=A0A432W5E5_9GAMM|nr:triose-phosphate isomerase [Aliidiomarina minuta]RUO25261.1 triose-phosphate isomerase [Aliidiomarina minuta]
MRQSLVIANWKLNGDLELVNFMVSALASESYTADVVICPPAPYLSALQQRTQNTELAVGGQNCSSFQQGAYTGEISASMLKEVGCEYVLVGHSERRSLFAEDDQVVASKLVAAQEAGLTAVLCVGESLTQREAGQTMSVVKQQLLSALQNADLNRLVVAYEPVWAIGTGMTASPEQAQEVHQEIRALLATIDAQQAQKISLLYGGSVKADNAEIIFAQEDIDGGLIGGASLVAEQFRAICSAVKG